MSQLRLNPLTGRWVTISSSRSMRPQPFAPRSLEVETVERDCPFCPGHEESTPPALESYGPDGTWQVRVVPNLFPAFYGDDAMAVTHLGPVWTQAPAGGVHEVLVMSRDHEGDWAGLSDSASALLMGALRDRIEEHSQLPTLRYSQAIVNYGREAGASIEHPHGQLLGIPFVPGALVEELRGFARFDGGCLLCTTVEAEATVGHRVVADDDQTVVLSPFWAAHPYELLVVPRSHDAHLHRADPRQLASVGRSVRDALANLRGLHGDVAYNVVFHSAPFRQDEDFHWHAHLVPKLTTVAGFELGTGVMINIVPPELAAQELRAAAVAAS